jgi:NADPH2:quinone reductase
MKAIRVHEPGGAEKLKYEETPVPSPGPKEALVKIEAAGINFIDIYFRIGLYKSACPYIPGMEAAGMVAAVGPEVSEAKVGDRVGYTRVPGAYAEYAVVPSWQLVPLPDSMSAQTAAAAMLQGITVHYLTHSTYPLKRGDTALIHAAAGGVGLLLVQVAKKLGARVIGTVSTEAKAQLAREAGADEIILYSQTDFEKEVKRLTGGKGVNVVYDSVGADTYAKSMNCLVRRGMLVLFGQASGPVPPIDPIQLSSMGSLYLTRANLMDHMSTREELLARVQDLFGWLTRGELRLRIERMFPLSAAAEAHRLLEGRKTTGKLLLIP